MGIHIGKHLVFLYNHLKSTVRLKPSQPAGRIPIARTVPFGPEMQTPVGRDDTPVNRSPRFHLGSQEKMW